MAAAAQTLSQVDFNGQFQPTMMDSDAYLPLVREVARSVHRRLPKHVELEDLISAGTLGLLSAWRRFDATYGVEFRTFARCRVRGAILDLLRENDWAPRDLRRRGRAIQKATATIHKETLMEATDAEIAQNLGMSLAKVQETKRDLGSLELCSLQETVGDGDVQRVDTLQDSKEENALARLLRMETQQSLAVAVDSLPERERLILTLSFYEELTMKEIGKLLDLSESRVSQLRTSAVKRLRASISRPMAA